MIKELFSLALPISPDPPGATSITQTVESLMISGAPSGCWLQCRPYFLQGFFLDRSCTSEKGNFFTFFEPEPVSSVSCGRIPHFG